MDWLRSELSLDSRPEKPQMFDDSGLGFRDSGFRVQGLWGLAVQGLGFGVGFGLYGLYGLAALPQGGVPQLSLVSVTVSTAVAEDLLRQLGLPKNPVNPTRGLRAKGIISYS